MIVKRYLLVTCNIQERTITSELYNSLEFAYRNMCDVHTFSTELGYNTVLANKTMYSITYDSLLVPVLISRIIELNT